MTLSAIKEEKKKKRKNGFAVEEYQKPVFLCHDCPCVDPP
jgi:hypothetical protein